MRLSIVAAALLPLVAFAEDTTTSDTTYSTTSTSTTTMTKYVTLERASSATGAPYGTNGTATYMPSGTGFYPTPTASSSNGGSGSGSPAATSSVPPPNAGSALSGANVALAAVAGVVVAAFM